jgi:hypothetical protein
MDAEGKMQADVTSATNHELPLVRRQVLEFFEYFKYQITLYLMNAALVLLMFGVLVYGYKSQLGMFTYAVFVSYIVLMGVAWYRVSRIAREFRRRYPAGEWRNFESGSESEAGWHAAAILGRALLVISSIWGLAVYLALFDVFRLAATHH